MNCPSTAGSVTRWLGNLAAAQPLDDSLRTVTLRLGRIRKVWQAAEAMP